LTKWLLFQGEIPKISHSELTDLVPFAEGGFGLVYRAKHARFGTVVYKELHAEKLGDRYSTDYFVLIRLHWKQQK